MKDSELIYDQEHELDPSMHPFKLDERLQSDCHYLGRLELCQLLLMNDCNYPWFILVPQRSDVRETFHLSGKDQQLLLKESNYLAENLNDIFNADKMNIAALGNIVPQLHVHHIVRFESDLVWPKPVWGVNPARPYSELQLATLMSRIEPILEGWSQFSE